MQIRTGTESGKEETKVYFMNSLTCSNKCELLRQFLKTEKKKIKGITSECVFNRLLRKDSKNSFTMRQTKPLTFHLSRFSAYSSTEIESRGRKPPEPGCQMEFSLDQPAQKMPSGLGGWGGHQQGAPHRRPRAA